MNKKSSAIEPVAVLWRRPMRLSLVEGISVFLRKSTCPGSSGRWIQNSVEKPEDLWKLAGTMETESLAFKNFIYSC